jgi:hypothetical protein
MEIRILMEYFCKLSVGPVMDFDYILKLEFSSVFNLINLLIYFSFKLIYYNFFLIILMR